MAHKGFSMSEARDVAQAIARLQEKKPMATLAGMPTLPPDQWTILPGYTFSLAETAEMCQLSEITIDAVLHAFALPPAEKNQAFRTIDDFNAANAAPLLRANGDFVCCNPTALRTRSMNPRFTGWSVTRRTPTRPCRTAGALQKRFAEIGSNWFSARNAFTPMWTFSNQRQGRSGKLMFSCSLATVPSSFRQNRSV